MKRYIRQIIIFLAIVLAAGFWQTRNMRSGQAPVTHVTSLSDNGAITLPSDSKSVEFFYFFAPWCQVCQYSVGNAELVAKWFPDIKLHYIALDYAETEEVAAFAKDHLKRSPYLGNELVRESWSISAYPSFAIVNSSGRISFVSMGYSTSFGMAIRVMLAKWGI